MKVSECSSCGAPVLWVVTEGGKRMPLDPDPSEAGNVVPLRTRDGLRARVLSGSSPEPPAGTPRHVSHFVTCPAAAQYRRRRSVSRRCAECQNPMSELLPADFVRHPLCMTRSEWAGSSWSVRALAVAS